MSIHFSQGKLQGQERISIIQEVQQQAKAAALTAINPLITAFLEAEQHAKLGRERGEPRRVSSQPREIDWQSRCEPLYTRWALSSHAGNGMGADRRIAGAHAGVPMLRP
jgi:hypothetical protein